MTQRTSSRLGLALSILVLTIGHGAAAQALPAGVLETPTWNGPHTGINLISGWHCTGRKIEIQIDDGELQTAGSRTGREDTRPVCGRADTGFGLLLNFNLLPRGQHRVTAYADGVPFAQQVFRTIKFGAPFLSDKQAQTTMLNFPEVGKATIVGWTEELQDFGATLVVPAPAIAGDYYGAWIERDCHRTIQVRSATYAVAYDGSSMAVTVRYVDGEIIEYPAAPASVDGAGYVRATFGEWTFRANGERLAADTSPLVDECLILPEVVAAK